MILVVGAGFAGSVIARELAEKGYKVKVIDSRSHVAGNCHTKRDSKTNIMEHMYGPHIFHTDDAEIWQYINKYTDMVPYIHRVKATSDSRVFSLPINLHTINQFFNKSMDPTEAMKFIEKQTQPIMTSLINFESKAISQIGIDLYECFYKNYTEKQWGIEPKLLSGEIVNRLPIRYDYDDNYYPHRYQGIPINGYTTIVESILNHKNIDIELGMKFNPKMKKEYNHIFYSGSIDSYFDYALGRLPYRTLTFNRFVASGDFQGCAVMNYCDKIKPFTRITEFKHFTPWEKHEDTIYIEEFSKNCGPNDIPYYPVGLANNSTVLEHYRTLAGNEIGTTFIGRLGTYKYLDMDVTIRQSLKAVCEFVKNLNNTNKVEGVTKDE